MKNKKLGVFGLVILAAIIGCEMPKEPDFTTSHKVEAPILFNKEYQFLGGDGALIDTTKDEFDSTFTVDSNDFIIISKEEDFDFGDLDDAIPVVSVNPTSFDAKVGELEIGSFSSGSSNLGTASFEDLTGLSPTLFPSGTIIPPGQSPRKINIGVGSNTDFFVSATIKSGAIIVSITNNLGFNITTAQIDLNSGSTFVNGTTIENINHGATTSGAIAFSPNDVLENINVDVSVSWIAQPTQADPGELAVENIEGDNLIASQVVAALDPQDFSTSNVTVIDDTEFEFTSPSHYVELESGTIKIDEIVNELDIAIDELVISFPTIKKGPNYSDVDSLVINYTDVGSIPRSGSSVAKSRSLAGYRIYAYGNEVTYHIMALTESTKDAPAGEQNRTINENDKISSSVTISDLKIAEAFGIIKQQNVLLNDDEGGDGVLDVMNDNEAELTEIDGLEDISSQLDGLDFTNPSLSINYTSNIGIETTVYGAFLGINGDNEQVFLNAINKNGSEYEVKPTDPISGLTVNGTQLEADQLIKFSLLPANGSNPVNGSVFFNKNTTNIDDFLNNLPYNIRFIGKAVVNEDESEGSIVSPLEFDPTISVDLPLAFKTETAATFKDTTEQDLGDIPSTEKGDDSDVTEGLLTVSYTNGLPLMVDLVLNFMDEDYNLITSTPLPTGEPIELLAAEVDPVTRFVTTPVSGDMVVNLSAEQLKQLYRTEYIEISARLITSEHEEVKVKTTDKITLSVSADFTIETEVN